MLARGRIRCEAPSQVKKGGISGSYCSSPEQRVVSLRRGSCAAVDGVATSLATHGTLLIDARLARPNLQDAVRMGRTASYRRSAAWKRQQPSQCAARRNLAEAAPGVTNGGGSTRSSTAACCSVANPTSHGRCGSSASGCCICQGARRRNRIPRRACGRWHPARCWTTARNWNS